MPQVVFRDYDRAALDREYDNRAKVKDAPEWLERYARESAKARAELSCRLDVAYGPSAGETLDVFPAPGSGPAPVHVFIHGGYWHRLDKADGSFVARGLLPAGAAVVVINYALIPTVQMAELVSQCRASIAWVHRHAASFGGDPRRTFVSGHSAGGSRGRWGSPEPGEQEPKRELELPRPQILLAQGDASQETAEAPVSGRGPDDRVDERRSCEEPALDPERVRELAADLSTPPRLV